MKRSTSPVRRIHPAGAPITVIGLGRVGIVAAACLASLGHEVTGLDSDPQRIEALQRGDMPIVEAGLHALVAAQVLAGRLHFTLDAQAAIPSAALLFVSVETPALANGASETSALDAIVAALCALAHPRAIVVLASTVTVGSAVQVQAALRCSHASKPEAPRVLSNPQFLRAGSAVEDFLKPERILIGCDDVAAGATAAIAQVYEPLTQAGVPLLVMDTRSAEFTKVAAGAMLAARISLVNELAALAQASGADIERVCEGVGVDQRTARDDLRAGLGYGGSRFPQDVAALRQLARVQGLRADMLGATDRVNGRQWCWPLHAMQRDFGGVRGLRGLRAAVWGLAFKPGTDDVHAAPSLMLIERMCVTGMSVAVFDPAAMEPARPLLSGHRAIRWCGSAEDALEGADVLLLVTEWEDFLRCAPEQVAAALKLRIVYDGRNALDAPRWRAAGLRVIQVGRPEVDSNPNVLDLIASREQRANAHQRQRRDPAQWHGQHQTASEPPEAVETGFDGARAQEGERWR